MFLFQADIPNRHIWAIYFAVFVNLAAGHMMLTGQSMVPPTRKHARWLCVDSLLFVFHTYTFFMAVREVPAGKNILSGLRGRPLMIGGRGKSEFFLRECLSEYFSWRRVLKFFFSGEGLSKIFLTLRPDVTLLVKILINFRKFGLCFPVSAIFSNFFGFL